MPRPSELTIEGRDDLKQAIARHIGKAKHICSIAHLVPYHEWRYFESQLELYVRLQDYLSSSRHVHHEKVFPRLADVKQLDEDSQLYDLILEFGGATLLAAKLDMAMQYKTAADSTFGGMRFGTFSLGFAVRLLHFIRRDMMAIDPSLTSLSLLSLSSNVGDVVVVGPRSIRMPTRRELVDAGEVQLAREVQLYGGHENIARRLGLGLCFDRRKEIMNHHDNDDDDDDAAPIVSELLGERRDKDDNAIKISPPKRPHRIGRKPKGYWNETVIIQEL